MYALNLSTRAQIWEYTYPNDAFAGGLPAFADGQVYGTFGVNESYSFVFALKASNGQNFGVSILAQYNPTLIRLFAMACFTWARDDKNVYALNVSTGKVVWNFTTGGFVIGSAAVDDSRVYIGIWDDWKLLRTKLFHRS